MKKPHILKPFTFFCIAIASLTGIQAVAKVLHLNAENLSSELEENWYVIIKDQGNFAFSDQSIFKIENDLIHVYPTQENLSQQPYAGLVTQKAYSHYQLELEYKWGKNKFAPRDEMVRDAGIMFHLFGEDVIWPNSLECQIQEGDTGDAWIVGCQASSTVQNVIRNYSKSGKKITRGSAKNPRFARFHRGYCWEAPGWNQVTVIVRGDSAEFYVNGKLVNALFDAKRPREDDKANQWIPLTSGKIMLQAEGAELFYRNIKLTELR